MTVGIAIAAAKGLLMEEHKNRLVENGGHKKLNRHWVYGFFRRMGFVQRKLTTAKSNFSVKNFVAKKKEFPDELATTVEMEEIPPELIKLRSDRNSTCAIELMDYGAKRCQES